MAAFVFFSATRSACSSGVVVVDPHPPIDDPRTKGDDAEASHTLLVSVYHGKQQRSAQSSSPQATNTRCMPNECIIEYTLRVGLSTTLALTRNLNVVRNFLRAPLNDGKGKPHKSLSERWRGE